MPAESIVLRGTEVHLAFQEYHAKSDDQRRGEFLARPTGVSSVEHFIESLTIDEHLELIAWQLEWKEAITALDDITTSVNIYNAVVATAEQRSAFLELVSRFPSPAVFEFTETYPMPPVFESNMLLRDLRDLGYRAALDDFGTGLNGVSLVTDIDFDIIKVDRKLVHDMRDRPDFERTMRVMIRLLNVLGRTHVVEGVETVEAYDLLSDVGFSVFQGFLFHMPIPVTALTPADQRKVST